MLEEVHSLLVALTFVPTERLQESKWNDPLQCFIAAYALREDKAFMEPHHITPVLAKCKFFLRSIVFWETLADIESFDNSFQK